MFNAVRFLVSAPVSDAELILCVACVASQRLEQSSCGRSVGVAPFPPEKALLCTSPPFPRCSQRIALTKMNEIVAPVQQN